LTTKWVEFYKDRRDLLTENIGKITAYQARQTSPKWDIYILEQIRDMLDIIDFLMQEKQKLSEEIETLTKRIEKRDNDITDILIKIQDWMKKYQPILDKIGEECEMLDKVERINENSRN
jgi:predicted  nucleic acid-binding Zn-ribbon protein